MTGIGNNPGFGANFNPGQNNNLPKKDSVPASANAETAGASAAANNQVISADQMMGLMARRANFGQNITAASLSVASTVHRLEESFSPEQFDQLQETFGQAAQELGLSPAATERLVEEAIANYVIGTPVVQP